MAGVAAVGPPRLQPRKRGHLVFTKPRRPVTLPATITISPHRDFYMSTASNVKTGKEVIEAILTADTPAKKAKATKLKNEFIARRVAEGKDARKVLAGLLSRVSRLRGGAAEAAPAAETKETAKAKTAPKSIGEDITGPRDDGEDLPEDEDSTEGEGEDRQGEVARHETRSPSQGPPIDEEAGR